MRCGAGVVGLAQVVDHAAMEGGDAVEEDEHGLAERRVQDVRARAIAVR